MGRRIAKLNYSTSLDNYIINNLSTYLQNKNVGGLTGGEICMLLNECGSDATYYIRDANGEVISVFRSYEYLAASYCGHNEFSEWNVYGSEEHGRFAVVKPKVKFAVNNNFNTTIPSQYSRIIGDKEYELKDHLGNIRVTLSDARENNTTAKVTSATSYLPFGMVEPNVFTSAGNHRFGFGGMEKDDEWKGEGNSLDFGARIYDPRGARFLSLDPMILNFPSQSPYIYAGNSPIGNFDDEGKQIENFMSKFKSNGKLKIKLPNESTAQKQVYKVTVQSTKKSYEQFISDFKKNSSKYLTNSKAEFSKPEDKNGKETQFKEGAFIDIAISGPMNDSKIKINKITEDKDNFSVQFITLEGHVEKGVINFTFTKLEDNKIKFEISSTSEVDYGSLRIFNFTEEFARGEQKESWMEVLGNFAKKIEGSVVEKPSAKIAEPKEKK